MLKNTKRVIEEIGSRIVMIEALTLSTDAAVNQSETREREEKSEKAVTELFRYISNELDRLGRKAGEE